MRMTQCWKQFYGGLFHITSVKTCEIQPADWRLGRLFFCLWTEPSD